MLTPKCIEGVTTLTTLLLNYLYTYLPSMWVEIYNSGTRTRPKWSRRLLLPLSAALTQRGNEFSHSHLVVYCPHTDYKR